MAQVRNMISGAINRRGASARLPGTCCPQCNGVLQPASRASPKSKRSPHRCWQAAARERTAPVTLDRALTAADVTDFRPAALPASVCSHCPMARACSQSRDSGQAHWSPGPSWLLEPHPGTHTTTHVRTVTALVPGASSGTVAPCEL